MWAAGVACGNSRVGQSEFLPLPFCAGAGRRKPDILELLEEYKRLAKLFQNAMKGMRIPKNLKGADMGKAMGKMDINQMSRMLPPGILKQMGGVGALQNLVKQLDGRGT